jgi:hypothetical protein
MKAAVQFDTDRTDWGRHPSLLVSRLATHDPMMRADFINRSITDLLWERRSKFFCQDLRYRFRSVHQQTWTRSNFCDSSAMASKVSIRRHSC